VRLTALAFLPAYASFMCINIFLQHQLQLFPVNFFFSFLTGLWVVSLIKALRVSPQSRE
jgi:hypothetical protein